MFLNFFGACIPISYAYGILKRKNSNDNNNGYRFQTIPHFHQPQKMHNMIDFWARVKNIQIKEQIIDKWKTAST